MASGAAVRRFANPILAAITAAAGAPRETPGATTRQRGLMAARLARVVCGHSGQPVKPPRMGPPREHPLADAAGHRVVEK